MTVTFSSVFCFRGHFVLTAFFFFCLILLQCIGMMMRGAWTISQRQCCNYIHIRITLKRTNPYSWHSLHSDPSIFVRMRQTESLQAKTHTHSRNGFIANGVCCVCTVHMRARPCVSVFVCVTMNIV